MPKTFSQTHLVSHGPPDDALLMQLLGERDHPGNLVTRDAGGVLAVEPARIPVKRAGLVCAVFAIGVTVLKVFAADWGLNFDGPLAWGLVVMTWVVILPAFLLVLVAVNRRFAGMGPYFRLDRSAGTLWCRDSDATMALGDIEELVELERWQRFASGSWSRTRQWTVVVRHDGERREIHPALREGDRFLLGNPLGKLLRDALGVRCRRIKLSAKESKALDDC